MTDHFHRHLSAALATVRRETPDLYAATARAFGPRTVSATVDDESLAIVRDGDALRIVAPTPSPTVAARSTHAALCEILAGQRTILDALWHGALDLRGTVDDLLALEHALRTFLQGAVRSPGLPEILRSFRNHPAA